MRSARTSAEAGHLPPPRAAIAAGYQFDVPVRFDTDYLKVDLSAFAAGGDPEDPVREIRGKAQALDRAL